MMQPVPQRPEPSPVPRRTPRPRDGALREAKPRPTCVGCIIGSVCDPNDARALHRLRPAETYLGERLMLDPPELYDDPEHGPAPTVERYWADIERRDSLAVWRTRRGAEPRFRRRAQHIFTVLLVIALSLAAFALGMHF
ncbi:MAG: hypothetical protein M3P49_06885 [Actinomycetota bacterium]|nr:hypothetical protein [Actinomycetota bacterium]